MRKYILLLISIAILLSSCATTDNTVSENLEIDMESFHIYKEYILNNEKIIIDAIPTCITSIFPEYVTKEDIAYYLDKASNEFPEYIDGVTYEILDSSLVINYPDIYTKTQVEDIINRLVDMVRLDLGIITSTDDFEDKESTGMDAVEEDKIIDPTNNRKSYDPENYDYTFGLIPPKDLHISFASHLYVDTAMLYGYPTLGATLDFGINVDTVTIAAYARYNHFFRPLGSATGRLAVGEELSELGLSFKVRIYELGRFNVNVGISSGWYQQWLMLGSNAGTYNLVNNGMMIRPEASIGWNWVGWWTMELGIFFQTPLYPSYNGYQGWGCFVKIL